MRALLQRVRHARVEVDAQCVGEVGRGLLVFVGIAPGDTANELTRLAQKILQLRIFPDANQKMNLSVTDIQGGLLVVSQFTLHADLRKGNRPSFTGAAPPQTAEPLYEQFVAYLKMRHTGPIGTGQFGASMQVTLCNDGPVTLWLDTDSWNTPTN